MSPHGQVYAHKLAEFMNAHYPPGTELAVWTSCLKRTVQTAEPMGREIVQWKGESPRPSATLRSCCCPTTHVLAFVGAALDEINAGICDGMTYEEIAKVYPAEYAARAAEKFK